jgi:hypothetical protein
MTFQPIGKKEASHHAAAIVQGSNLSFIKCCRALGAIQSISLPPLGTDYLGNESPVREQGMKGELTLINAEYTRDATRSIGLLLLVDTIINYYLFIITFTKYYQLERYISQILTMNKKYLIYKSYIIAS